MAGDGYTGYDCAAFHVARETIKHRHMKKFTLSLFVAALLGCSLSCGNLQSISGLPGMQPPGSTGSMPPTSTEISSGLKQALQIGLKEGIQEVSAKDGFFKNAMIKVLFPPEAQKIERTLRQVGMGSLCDNVILSLNRAAEDASKKALPIFLNALKTMSFRDATNILLGPDTAATYYFKTATTAALTKSFAPVISNSLNKVEATRYWGTVMTQYNKLPLVKPVNTDLSAYVTQRAIDGLFAMVAKKELAIRSQLSDRTTPLLKKVFGYADQKKP